VTCLNVTRKDKNSFMHIMDLSSIFLNGIRERTVYGQQETDSMSAMKDHDSEEKEGQDRGHNPVQQFHEDRIFNKESERKIIAAKAAEEEKLMAVREEGGQQEHVTRTISHIEPDYKEHNLYLV
jgi:hypothetical protein